MFKNVLKSINIYEDQFYQILNKSKAIAGGLGIDSNIRIVIEAYRRKFKSCINHVQVEHNIIFPYFYQRTIIFFSIMIL
jgi:hypothetical protein